MVIAKIILECTCKDLGYQKSHVCPLMCLLGIPHILKELPVWKVYKRALPIEPLQTSARATVLLGGVLCAWAHREPLGKSCLPLLVMSKCWRHFPVCIDAVSFEAAVPTVHKGCIPPFDAKWRLGSLYLTSVTQGLKWNKKESVTTQSGPWGLILCNAILHDKSFDCCQRKECDIQHGQSQFFTTENWGKHN